MSPEKTSFVRRKFSLDQVTLEQSGWAQIANQPGRTYKAKRSQGSEERTWLCPLCNQSYSETHTNTPRKRDCYDIHAVTSCVLLSLWAGDSVRSSIIRVCVKIRHFPMNTPGIILMIGKQVRLLIIWAANNDKQVTPAHAANGFFVYPVILSLIMPRYCIT